MRQFYKKKMKAKLKKKLCEKMFSQPPIKIISALLDFCTCLRSKLKTKLKRN